MSLDWGDGHYETTAADLAVASAEALAVCRIQPGERVLDVGTGTGNAALPAIEAGAEVIAIDPAQRLLDVAAERARAVGATLTTHVAGATALPVPEDWADATISVFAVIFEPDGPAAVRELVRVTKPGGRIVLAAWNPDGPIAAIGRLLRQAMAANTPPGSATSDPAPTNWTDPEAVTALFAPYPATLSTTTRPLTFRGSSPAGWFDEAEQYHPVWRAGRRQLGEATWAQIRADSIAELAAANEDPSAFAATSTYRIIRADLRQSG